MARFGALNKFHQVGGLDELRPLAIDLDRQIDRFFDVGTFLFFVFCFFVKKRRKTNTQHKSFSSCLVHKRERRRKRERDEMR